MGDRLRPPFRAEPRTLVLVLAVVCVVAGHGSAGPGFAAHDGAAKSSAHASAPRWFASRMRPPIARATGTERPNVVVVLMDDLGYGDVRSFGAPDVETPNIDSLARDGVRMTDNYTAAPMCSPTRAAFMTGRYQQRCGIEKVINNGDANRVGLPPEETSLARMLGDAGYRTSLVGKWHLGGPTTFGPNAHGFDEFYGVLSNCDYYTHTSERGSQLFYDNRTPIMDDGYLTDLFTEKAVATIDALAGGDAPFFLEVAYTAVHVPHQNPDDPTDIRTKETWYESTRADYVKMIERADVGVGRILGAIGRNGIGRDTLVIFASDNGGDFRRDARNAPLRGGKYQLFEGGLRSPTIVRWPAVLPAGAVCAQVSITMDLTATILSAAGVAPARRLDGIDLVPILSGAAPIAERDLFWRNDCSRVAPVRAARVGNWKYLRFRSGESLFDLSTDIGEEHDVIRAHRDVARMIRLKLKQWEHDVDATPHRFTVRCG